MKKLIGRLLIVVPSVALQVAWYVLLFTIVNLGLHGYLGDILTVVFSILSVIFVLYLVSKRDEGAYKIIWIIIRLTFFASSHSGCFNQIKVSDTFTFYVY